MPPDTFTPRELDVMSILWDLGSATVADAQERIGDPLAYTTVLSVLRTLTEKGYVRHEAEGRAYRYYALVDWTAAGRRELSRLVTKVFKGSPELLLVQFVSDRNLDERQLRRLNVLRRGRIVVRCSAMGFHLDVGVQQQSPEELPGCTAETVNRHCEGSGLDNRQVAHDVSELVAIL